VALVKRQQARLFFAQVAVDEVRRGTSPTTCPWWPSWLVDAKLPGSFAPVAKLAD
jgi:hypothetical protein